MALRVLEPGPYTLPVDFGRPRTRERGVPLGGAADRASLALGNALLGNPPDAAALEFALAGPTLQALSDVAAVVYGAPFDLRLGTRSLCPGSTFTWRVNDVLRIGGVAEGRGARAYLCVRGGFLTLPILDSRSGLLPLPRGAEIACPAATIPTRFLTVPFGPGKESDPRIRVLPGAQADWFPRDCFHGQPFIVTPRSNRMGLRLDGPLLPLPARELVSEPVCPGAVQVTRDGRCIVLGVDGQTIGGYPKIAQVISADLDRLGQFRPGDPIVFRLVSLEEAETSYHDQQTELRRWLTRLGAAEIFVASKETLTPRSEIPKLRRKGQIAQLVERRTENP